MFWSLAFRRYEGTYSSYGHFQRNPLPSTHSLPVLAVLGILGNVVLGPQTSSCLQSVSSLGFCNYGALHPLQVRA